MKITLGIVLQEILKLADLIEHRKSDKMSFSIEEAADACGYSRDTIRAAIRNHDMTARYANSKPVILATELQDWLTSLPTEAPTK